MQSSPPTIFSPHRKRMAQARAAARSARADHATYLLDAMAEDVFDRLGFLRFDPANVLLEGYGSALLAQAPWVHRPSFAPTDGRDFGAPLPLVSQSYEMVASINSIGTVNDVPGALIQMRELLVPGGLAIASFLGGGSLPRLRAAMLASEPDRPAPRIHPMIDPRSCPALLSRAGWQDPVVDSWTLQVRYPNLRRLVGDLRDQAMGNVLAQPAPPLSRAALARAEAAFARHAEDDGKVTETFEIVTLTGRRPR